MDVIFLRFGSISDTKVLLYLPRRRQRVTEPNPCRVCGVSNFLEPPVSVKSGETELEVEFVYL